MTWENLFDLILLAAALITLYQLSTKYLGEGGAAA
jgi:hypothetical protein